MRDEQWAIRDLKSRPTDEKEYLQVGEVQEPVSPFPIRRMNLSSYTNMGGGWWIEINAFYFSENLNKSKEKPNFQNSFPNIDADYDGYARWRFLQSNGSTR